MKLTVSQSTFEKNLKKEGIAIKILDYTSFMKGLKEHYVKELKEVLLTLNGEEINRFLLITRGTFLVNLGGMINGGVPELSISYVKDFLETEEAKRLYRRQIKNSQKTIENGYRLYLSNKYKDMIFRKMGVRPSINRIYSFFQKKVYETKFHCLFNKDPLFYYEFIIKESSASYINAKSVKKEEYYELSDNKLSQIKEEFKSLLFELREEAEDLEGYFSIVSQKIPEITEINNEFIQLLDSGEI